jgi:hypothetical protein
MKLRLAMTLAAGALAIGLPAGAHHSFPATYMVDQEMTVEGRLVAFMYRNPHAFIHVNVTDKRGDTTRWAVEWGSATALAKQTADRKSVSRGTLRPGDHVIVTGNPGRNPEDHMLRLRRIERPADGWVWEGDADAELR